MKPFFTLFLFATSLCTLLFSTELFLNQEWENARGIYEKTESYCHSTKEEKSFCQKSTISYPIFNHAPKKNISSAIDNIVQKIIKDFKKEDLQKAVLENLKDESYQPVGNWENKNALDLFTVTTTTFTTITRSSDYTGGLHDYYSVEYQNYDHLGRPLKLNTLLKADYNTTLHKKAEYFYRKKVDLAENESNNPAKQIILLDTVPLRTEMFIIRFRASFKNGESLVTMPKEWDGVKGQQAFSNYQLLFPLIIR